jgi:hypothetical protein
MPYVNPGVDGVTIEQTSEGPEIAAEQIQNQQQPQPSNQQPPQYFIPRVKIAIGDVDKDKGDANAATPLQTRDRAILREAEIASLAAFQDVRNGMTDRHGEVGWRGMLLDRRGAVGIRGRLR